MLSVVSDPKVTSMITKARGEKGYRMLQGEKVRNLLIKLIQTQV